MARLYELTDNYAALLAQLDDAETDAQRDEIMQAITDCSAEIGDKAEAYARIMKNAEADAAAYDAEIRRLTARKRTAEASVKRLKDNLCYAMEVAGATEIKTSIGRWKMRQNPPRVEVMDENEVAPEFFEPQPPKLMKSKLMQHWRETGEIPDGCDIVRDESVGFR